MGHNEGTLRKRPVLRRATGYVFYALFLLAVMVGIAGLLLLLTQVLIEGLPWISSNLVLNFPSRHAEEAGLRSALMGTIWLMVLTAGFTVPVGVGAAIFLEEYAV